VSTLIQVTAILIRKDKQRDCYRSWRAKNRPHVYLKQRAWSDNNREKLRECSRRSSQKPHCRATRKLRGARNRDKLNARQRARYNKESTRQRHLRRRLRDPEHYREVARAAQKRWRERNPQRSRDVINNSYARHIASNRLNGVIRRMKRRALQLAAPGSYTEADWKVVCAKFENRCPACGKSCKLTADHIIPLSKDGSHNIENIQPLCKSCNSRKGTRLIVCYLPWRREAA
jgi:5-methylcytosine-specific restriction endonuclease McrA